MSSQQIPPAWSERGYVPPELLDTHDDEDEKGEAAYMRCFHESSKIGRVPNASFFVNSPTARAYIEKRDKELFPVKEASAKLIPNPDMPSWSSREEFPKNQAANDSGPLPTSNITQPPPLPRTMTMPPIPDFQPPSQQTPPPAPSSVDQVLIPWSMEPRTGASGPPRMIR